MLIVCETSVDCNKVFLTLYRSGGSAENKPHFLQSRKGTVLMQLSRSLDRATVARYEEVVRELP